MFRSSFVILVQFCIVVMPGFAGEETETPDIPRKHPEEIRETIESEIEQHSDRGSWRTRNQLLGGMGGLRPWLAKNGMTLEFNSYDEGFANPDSGLDTETGQRYAGLTNFILSFDTEAVGWWKGGLFVVGLQNTRGGDISDLVGDAQGISNIVAPPGTRFAEYHLIQQYSNLGLTFKIGKQDANADFVVSEGGGEFINSSFGLIPTVPLPTFPAPALGVMGAWRVSDRIMLKVGVWDGSPVLGSGSIGTAFDGDGGSVGAAGIEISPFGADILDGTYRIGVWRHSEVEISTETRDGAGFDLGPTEGVYFTVDQGLWERDTRRFAFFAQGGWGESDRAAISRYFGGGLTLSGPFDARPDDVMGLAVAYADIGYVDRQAPAVSSETVIEFFYRLPVTPWISLIPDIQWVHRPSGLDGTALVAGIRVATVF